MANDLTVIEHVNGTSLEVYRDRNEVRELADRLLSLHPAAAEVGKSGMVAIAQLALMVGASPLPGTNEIHVWKNGNKVQFQLGVNYYRRKAQEQGGLLWFVQPRQMNDAERQEYGIVQGQLAAICSGVRADDMDKWLKKGFDGRQVFDMLSATGVSVAGMNEGKHGRPAVWTALKRAEVDLYRQLFPTMMQEITQAQMNAPDVIVETDPGPSWDDFDFDAANDELFSPDGSAVEEAVYEDIEPEAETDQEPTEPAAYTDQIITMASKLEENERPTFGSVVSAVMVAGVGYNHDNHVLGALAQHPELIKAKIKPTERKRVRKEKAIMFYWWLIDRKLETVEGDEEE